MILTTGLLPVCGTAKTILDVNLVGAANVVDVSAAYADEGTSIVCIASMGGYGTDISKDLEYNLTTVETGRLLDDPDLHPSALDSGTSYMIAIRANYLRVQELAHLWAYKGARLDSISPGVISTEAENAQIEAEAEVKRLEALSYGSTWAPYRGGPNRYFPHGTRGFVHHTLGYLGRWRCCAWLTVEQCQVLARPKQQWATPV